MLFMGQADRLSIDRFFAEPRSVKPLVDPPFVLHGFRAKVRSVPSMFAWISSALFGSS